ncbi:MAG: hypothetical protein QOI47_1445 [Actinomycetota bacterium]|nr:hypothetical protein [Actinomycetota bacterium]
MTRWGFLFLAALGLAVVATPTHPPQPVHRPAAEADRGPESVLDVERAGAYNRARLGSEADASLASASAQRARLAASSTSASIAGARGTWTPYGHGPLLGNDPTYPATLGDGFGKMAGRINDLVYVPQTSKLYAAVAQGGLWESTDVGAHWKPIADNLPVQSTGSVAYTPAGGGTLVVVTGDMAFSNDYAGVGTFWSTDDGASWHKAAGAPDGALAFRVVVDPTSASTVYVATGKGLYRSTDAARTFTNVDLPTGACHGHSEAHGCFFANMVTDVAVQATDTLGHKGGAVVAAVGWRAGRLPNFDGTPQAPANGLYRSTTGAPGTFGMVPDSAGFTPSARAGRIALGATTGPAQDSRDLYAVAQDAVLFAGQTTTGGEQDIPLVGTPSVLDAIYVSPDFGASWTVMETRQEMIADVSNGSSLSQLTALGIGPGYQATYNEFIKPDPTRQSATGVPTRVSLGLEEVWQNAIPSIPQDGHTRFQVIGSYTASGGACLVVPEQCGTVQQVAPHTTTHPDQHGIAWVPDGSGGVTLVVGNDGGAYRQHAASGSELTQLGWGDGANIGFETLLPYGAAMAKDGTVYAGLQDNGQLKILPNGEQHTVYVGDGTFALVDPNRSNIAYDELPNAGINVTTDGGSTWTSMDPSVKSADFVAPMVMDGADAKHLLAAGRDIAETTSGATTTTCRPVASDPTSCTPSDTDWKYVFDLGTHNHPGDANAVESDTDAPNIAVAAALDGDRAFIGFCGDCDPVKLHRRFHTGFATNVGGSKPPKKGTSDGWHIAAAAGLPGRTITSVVADPLNPATVYVTLGASAARYFSPIGSLGEDTSAVGSGHVYKSTDAGQTFHDISGDLPDVQATWALLRGQQLIVGTAIGTFTSAGDDGGHYGLLGTGIPPVAVYQLSFKPGDDTTIVAATYGRGVWTYHGSWKAASPAVPRGVLPVTGGSGGVALLAVALGACALVARKLAVRPGDR